MICVLPVSDDASGWRWKLELMSIPRFRDRNVDGARELVRRDAKEKPSEMVTCKVPYKRPMTSKNSTLPKLLEPYSRSGSTHFYEINGSATS